MTDTLYELRLMAYIVAAVGMSLALFLQNLRHSREILQALKDKWTWKTEAQRATEELKYASLGKAELLERLESHQWGQYRILKRQDRYCKTIEKWQEATGCKTPEAFKAGEWLVVSKREVEQKEDEPCSGQ